jgi:hypothetical protein
VRFTFGIITTSGNETRVQKVLDSISNQSGFDPLHGGNDCYEVIVVGGDTAYKEDNYTIIPFDESKKPMWITRKKNIITENAKYENVVYFHDYVSLVPGWYEGFKKFGNDFDICMTPILNADGSRFRDWTLYPDDLYHAFGNWKKHNCLLPYDIKHLSKYMYISGAYWIAKKDVMQKFPLNESLGWGEGEDFEWSWQVRKEYDFSINTNSMVKLLKFKDPIFSMITKELLDKVLSHAPMI